LLAPLVTLDQFLRLGETGRAFWCDGRGATGGGCFGLPGHGAKIGRFPGFFKSGICAIGAHDGMPALFYSAFSNTSVRSLSCLPQHPAAAPGPGERWPQPRRR